ncbi:hypothetical protein Pfo_029767 [Paulownia fortunei]|nr:hypothetical protein Pfo_029767 [Paulownia fortunei]
MDKMLTVNQKRANKQQPKSKKKLQPLKVVYITNPIKFTASASEFRALVQELTGQDSDMAESARFAVDDGVGGSQGKVANAGKVAVEDNVHALEEVTKIRRTCDGVVVQKGSDPSTFGSYDDDDDAFCSPQMMDSFPGLMASDLWHEAAHLDVLKNLDAM